MSMLFLYFFRFLVVSSVVILLVGLFKPEWMRYRDKQPDPMMALMMALGLFIVGFTGASKTYFSVDDPVIDVAKSGGKIPVEAVYSNELSSESCEPGSKPGKTGSSDNEKTDDGIYFSVRTPTNYNETIAHPLLMVYAPAARDRSETEEFMYLTRDATEAGFIIAYADHRPLSPESIVQLAEIPKQIEQKWCIDKKRIFLTGHSDGGTIAMGTAFYNGTKHIAAAIAPSAVGIRGDDLEDRNCVKPLPVMLMHSSRDKLFPNFGKEAIEWWAKCNKCKTKTYSVNDRKKSTSSNKWDWEDYYKQELEQKAQDLKTGQPLPYTAPVNGVEGCVAYSGCKNDVQTWYCEGVGPHPEWPGKNKAIINFFKAVTIK
jgi:polyhydroxybutyrate depolymerase